jgi:hypothetical protein
MAFYNKIRTGVFDAKNNETSFDDHRRVKSASESCVEEEVGHGHGPVIKRGKGRRRSLAQFEDVNQAVLSCGVVTVTETLDLGVQREERVSDVSKDGTIETSCSARSEDFDFDLAIEKQVTTCLILYLPKGC